MPRLIPTMTKLGYSPDKKGVCFGIAAMGAQSVVREQPQKFFQRIKRIHNLTKEDIATLSTKRDQKDVDELYYFFDGLVIYQGVGALASEFESIIPDGKQSIDSNIIFKDADLAKSKEINKNNELNFADIKEKLVCSVTAKELSELILDLKSHLNEQAFSLLINYPSPAHTVQIGFSNGVWLTVNHDNINIHKKNNNIRLMIRKIIPKKWILVKKHKFNVSIDVLLSEQANADLSFLEKYKLNDKQLIRLKNNKKAMMDLIISCAYANQHESLLKIFEHIDFSSLVDECIEDNFVALFATSCYDHAETAKLLLQAIENAKLTPEQIMSLLGVKYNGSTNLEIAAYYGRVEVAKHFLNAIENVRLTSEQKVSLLQAENDYGVAALFLATQNGHTEFVKAYLEAINHATSLTSEQKTRLLEAKTKAGVPALIIAAQSGHTETVKIYLEAIKDAELTFEQKVSLLTAKTDKGVPALFLAVQNGHTEIVKMFLETIENAKLSTKQKLSLLEARVKEGKTALEVAALVGHTEATEYIEKAILTLKNEDTDVTTWF